MIISNNVLQLIEPFYVYRHLQGENICLSFSAIIFCLGSPGLKQQQQLKVLWESMFTSYAHPHPQGIRVILKHIWGKRMSKKKEKKKGGWSLLSLFFLAWGCVQIVNVYIVSLSVCVFFCGFFFFCVCVCLGSTKPLTQKEISTKHKGLITVHCQSKQPRCSSLSVGLLIVCPSTDTGAALGRQSLGVIFLWEQFSLAAHCWPLLTYTKSVYTL